jgi:excisionase family DNA binding protein
MGEQIFSVQEISGSLGVSRTTIYNWMNSGELRYTERRVGKKTYRDVPESALRDFAESSGVDVSSLLDVNQGGLTPCVATCETNLAA